LIERCFNQPVVRYLMYDLNIKNILSFSLRKIVVVFFQYHDLFLVKIVACINLILNHSKHHLNSQTMGNVYILSLYIKSRQVWFRACTYLRDIQSLYWKKMYLWGFCFSLFYVNFDYYDENNVI
jgi:hypothetical protein